MRDTLGLIMTSNLQLHMLKGQQSQEQARGRQGAESPLPFGIFSLKSGMFEGDCLSFFGRIPCVYVFFGERESVCVHACVPRRGEAGEVWREGTG